MGVDEGGVLKIWDTATVRVTTTTRLRGISIQRIWFSPDRHHVNATRPETVRQCRWFCRRVLRRIWLAAG